MSQYPPANPGPQDGYNASSHPEGPNYEDYETTAPPGVPPGPHPGPTPGTRKKRAYAGQAYEFGGNAVQGQQQVVGYSGFSQQQDAAGYPQGGYKQTPAAVQMGQVPLYGHQDATVVGGYQASAPTYPTQTPAVGGVNSMTQQFGQMDMSQKPGGAAPPAQNAPVLNQLYPTDLLNQPFNVAELDYPPPPAILPPNVREPPCIGHVPKLI
jgi:protein transport protein SEC24